MDIIHNRLEGPCCALSNVLHRHRQIHYYPRRKVSNHCISKMKNAPFPFLFLGTVQYKDFSEPANEISQRRCGSAFEICGPSYQVRSALRLHMRGLRLTWCRIHTLVSSTSLARPVDSARFGNRINSTPTQIPPGWQEALESTPNLGLHIIPSLRHTALLIDSNILLWCGW